MQLLADIITPVRGKLSDDAYDKTLITNAANWFVNDLFTTTRTRLMEESDQLFASAGDTTVDLPDDMQTLIKEGLIVVSPQIYKIDDYFKEYGDFMNEFPGYTAYTASQLTYWTTYGNSMRFAAPLLADTTINIDYVRRPTQMVRDTDVCEVPDVYQELVVLGTLARCMQTNEDYGEASQELANLTPLRTTFIRNEGRGQIKTGPVIVRTNRRRGNIRNNGWD